MNFKRQETAYQMFISMLIGHGIHTTRDVTKLRLFVFRTLSVNTKSASLVKEYIVLLIMG